jgi:hypothetical protein
MRREYRQQKRVERNATEIKALAMYTEAYASKELDLPPTMTSFLGVSTSAGRGMYLRGRIRGTGMRHDDVNPGREVEIRDQEFPEVSEAELASGAAFTNESGTSDSQDGPARNLSQFADCSDGALSERESDRPDFETVKSAASQIEKRLGHCEASAVLPRDYRQEFKSMDLQAIPSTDVAGRTITNLSDLADRKSEAAEAIRRLKVQYGSNLRSKHPSREGSSGEDRPMEELLYGTFQKRSGVVKNRRSPKASEDEISEQEINDYEMFKDLPMGCTLKEAYTKRRCQPRTKWGAVTSKRGFFPEEEGLMIDFNEPIKWGFTDVKGNILELVQAWPPMRTEAKKDMVVPLLSLMAGEGSRVLIPNRTGHNPGWRWRCEEGSLKTEDYEKLATKLIRAPDRARLPPIKWQDGLKRFCLEYVAGRMQLEELMGATCFHCEGYYTMMDQPHDQDECKSRCKKW